MMTPEEMIERDYLRLKDIIERYDAGELTFEVWEEPNEAFLPTKMSYDAMLKAAYSAIKGTS